MPPLFRTACSHTPSAVSYTHLQAEFFLSAIEGREAAMRPAMRFDRFRGLDVQTINAIGEAFLSTVCLLYTSRCV